MTLADEQLHRFTRDEYHQMAEVGLFDDKRVELLEGRILDMSPQNEPHITTITQLFRLLIKHLPDTFEIRCQAPINAAKYSEPEPDFAVIEAPPSPRKENPATALLVIEVAHTTLHRDRAKTAIYASASVPEYWIIDLRSRSIEQYTQPVHSADGWAYLAMKTHREADVIACASIPLPPASVSDFLPPL